MEKKILIESGYKGGVFEKIDQYEISYFGKGEVQIKSKSKDGVFKKSNATTTFYYPLEIRMEEKLSKVILNKGKKQIKVLAVFKTKSAGSHFDMGSANAIVGNGTASFQFIVRDQAEADKLQNWFEELIRETRA